MAPSDENTDYFQRPHVLTPQEERVLLSAMAVDGDDVDNEATQLSGVHLDYKQ
jgi:hypothetical protein